jgi:hypothetical protein
MKKKFARIIFATSFIAVVSCTNKPAIPPTPPAGNEPSFAQVRTSINIAMADVQRYQDTCRIKFGKDPINAYTIHAEDLVAALGWPKMNMDSVKYKYVRAYLGLNSNNEFKLYIVPVFGADLSNPDKSKWIGGDDVFFDSTGTGIPSKKGLKSSEDEGYVLDLNAPCPNTCASEGLFTSIRKKL